ncbi:MAG: hypothetical protein ACOC4M_15235, partial [Promethearchaeia archaeon]
QKREKEQEKPKPKPKEACPYCAQEFVSVSRHLPYCDKNPENQAHEKDVGPQVEKKYSAQEEADMATALLNWIQGYRNNVIKHPNGKNALEMERILRLYKKVTGRKFNELKYPGFAEWIKKNNIYGGVKEK